MKLHLSPAIREKLANKQPLVTEEEIIECFANQTHEPLTDTREEHLTDPLTRWFIAETDHGRRLKIVYVPRAGGIYIKSAYDPSDNVIRIYSKFAEPLGDEP